MTKDKCTATTKAGKPCKLSATDGGRCSRHAVAKQSAPKSARAAKKSEKPAPVQTTAPIAPTDPDEILRDAFVTLLFDAQGNVFLGQLSFSRKKLEELELDTTLYARREIVGGGILPTRVPTAAPIPKKKQNKRAEPPEPKTKVPEGGKCAYVFSRGSRRGELCSKAVASGFSRGKPVDLKFCATHLNSGPKTTAAAQTPAPDATKLADTAPEELSEEKGYSPPRSARTPVVAAAPVVKATCPDFYVLEDVTTIPAKFRLKGLDLDKTLIAHNKNYLRINIDSGNNIDEKEFETYGILDEAGELGWYVGSRGFFHIVKRADTNFSLKEVLGGIEQLTKMRGLSSARISSVVYSGKSASAVVKTENRTA